jgi:hypothetical protein
MELGAQNENSMVSHKGVAVLIDKNVVLSRVNNCFDEKRICVTHAGEITVYYVARVH